MFLDLRLYVYLCLLNRKLLQVLRAVTIVMPRVIPVPVARQILVHIYGCVPRTADTWWDYVSYENHDRAAVFTGWTANFRTRFAGGSVDPLELYVSRCAAFYEVPFGFVDYCDSLEGERDNLYWRVETKARLLEDKE